MKKRKICRVFLLILSICCLGMTACGNKAEEEKEPDGQVETEVENMQEESEAEDSEEEDPEAEEGYTAEQDGYSTVTRWTSNGDKNIFGVMYLPEGFEEDQVYPAMILSHGLGGRSQNNDYYASRFAKQGIVCYAYDFCCGAYASRSDGATNEYSVMTEKEDLKAVIDFMKGFDFVDDTKLVLFGQSMGGLVTSLAAADRADEIAGAVLLYPAFSILDDMYEVYPSAEEIPTEDSSYMGQNVNPMFFQDVYGMDLLGTAAAYERPVLIVHGTGDTMVPHTYSEELAAAYQNARLELIEGAAHGFEAVNGESTEEAKEQTYDFTMEFLQENGIVTVE